MYLSMHSHDLSMAYIIIIIYNIILCHNPKYNYGNIDVD